jgi:hypothetical protein
VKPRKLLGGAVMALLAFYTVTNPTDAATNLREILAGLAQFAGALTGGGQ